MSEQTTGFDDLLEANAEYAKHNDILGFDGIAQAGIAVVTCMDSRIDPLGMIGLHAGDAKIFRNPGGRVTAAAMEALVLSVHLLRVDRILIVPHTRCSMASNNEQELRAKITASAGQDASWQGFHVVADQESALRADVFGVRAHPLIGGRAEVGGFMYDVDTGLLRRLL